MGNEFNLVEEVLNDFISIMEALDRDFLKCPKCKEGIMLALEEMNRGQDSS